MYADKVLQVWMTNKSCHGSVVGIKVRSHQFRLWASLLLFEVKQCRSVSTQAVVEVLVIFHPDRRLSLFREGGRICSHWCKQSHLLLRLCWGSPQMACLRHSCSHFNTSPFKWPHSVWLLFARLFVFTASLQTGGRFCKMTNMSRGNGKQQDLVWPFVYW